MLRKEKRANGMVWTFRWSEEVNGQRHQPKEVIGTTKQFPTEAAANREPDRLRCRLNENKQLLSLKTMRFGELINHYLDHELPRLSKFAQRKQVIHQELDRASLVWPRGQLHEDHGDSGVARWDRTPRWNQAEDQEHSFLDRKPVCGQGGTPGHRAASTGVRQSNRISIRRVILPPDVVRQTLEQLPLREATMALVDAVTALRASELVALKWTNVRWDRGILHSELALVEGELKETKSGNNALPLAPSCFVCGASAHPIARRKTGSLPVPISRAGRRTRIRSCSAATFAP
jgi:integrase